MMYIMRGEVDTINQPPVGRRRKKKYLHKLLMLNFLNYCYYGRTEFIWSKL